MQRSISLYPMNHQKECQLTLHGSAGWNGDALRFYTKLSNTEPNDQAILLYNRSFKDGYGVQR
jgi:hypothetical protein